MKRLLQFSRAYVRALALILVLAIALVPARAETLDRASILAAYIEGEAGGEGLSVMCAVGAVIVNRCVYGTSIVSEGAALGIIPSPDASPMAHYAASLVLGGVDLTDGAVVFYRGAVPNDRSVTVTYSAGGYFFARR